MRINAYVARSTGISRRAADKAITKGRVQVNGQPAALGQTIGPSDAVTLDGEPVTPEAKSVVIMLNKPPGYVCSRQGQGSKTVYDLLPAKYHHLKPIGRLDKDSSGLLLLTNDGGAANRLTHPRYGKTKVYEIELDKSLSEIDKNRIEQGIKLDDGISKLTVSDASGKTCQVKMTEGRNRQIRRTFAALGYTVTKLHRTQFGDYKLSNLPTGKHCKISA